MAHYAQLNEQNVVTRIVEIPDLADVDEDTGAAYCKQNFGDGTWLKTSPENNFRANFAQKNYTYEILHDAFVAPQPHASWILDHTTHRWAPPRPRPDSGYWMWDEQIQDWKSLS